MSEFEKVCKSMESVDIGSLSNDEKLEIYALFKQATVGDVNIDKPGMFNMKGKAKWEAWNGKKGLSKADAQAKYIEITKKYLD